MAAGHEDPSMRRRNYHHGIDGLTRLLKSLRDGYDDAGPCPANTDYRIAVPNSTAVSPRVGDMDDATIAAWARRVSAADAEVSINQTNESLGRAKYRSGEAA